MLPFIPSKRTQTMIMGRKEEGKPMEMPVEEHPQTPAAEDLIHAIHSKDIHAVARALQASHEIHSSMPGQEEDHAS